MSENDNWDEVEIPNEEQKKVEFEVERPQQQQRFQEEIQAVWTDSASCATKVGRNIYRPFIEEVNIDKLSELNFDKPFATQIGGLLYDVSSFKLKFSYCVIQ